MRGARRLDRTPTAHRIAALATAGAITVLAGCSSGDSATAAPTTTVVASTASPTTSAPPPDAPPIVEMPELSRAEIGQTLADAIVVEDPEGSPVTVRIIDSPPGFFPVTNSRGLVTGFEWTPPDAGRWTFEVMATDGSGLITRARGLLIGRYPRPRDLLLAMGDSVPSGFGRDRTDYLGADDCWRSEEASYPDLVFEELIVAGGLAADAEMHHVACAGTPGDALDARVVSATDRNGDLLPGERTQLDWAVTSNPTVITLTAGADDVLFTDPHELVDPDAGNDPAIALRLDELELRLARIDDGLDETLGTLISHTDAHVAVTTYYDPTADDPVGVDGCERECFGAVGAELTSRLNATIASVVRRHPRQRVTIVRLDDAFDGHRAPNGFGPDFVREADFGPFGGLIDRFTGDSSPYCDEGDGPDETYLTRLDCVHPNDDGHEVIAARVAAALLSL